MTQTMKSARISGSALSGEASERVLIGDVMCLPRLSCAHWLVSLSFSLDSVLVMSVFASSASDLLRFVDALQQRLTPLALTVACDSSSTRAQTAAQQLLDAMQRENQGQMEALKRHFPAVFSSNHGTAAAAAAAVASCNPHAYMQFEQEAMQLQIATDEAAARAAALL